MPKSRVTSFVTDERGLTLIELVVAMVLSAILAGFIANVIYYEVNVYHEVTNRKSGMRDARLALEMVARDLRTIMAADSVFQATSDSIRFDIVGDRQVTYRYENGQLIKNQGLLLPNLAAFRLRYYDDSGTPLASPVANPDRIRRISVEFAVAIEQQTVSFTATVAPRNL